MKSKKHSYLLILSIVFLLQSCDSQIESNSSLLDSSSSSPSIQESLSSEINEEDLFLKDYKQLMLSELEKYYNEVILSTNGLDEITSKYNEGIELINDAETINEIMNLSERTKVNIANCIPLANGNYSFKNLSNQEKIEIVGLLEQYAINNSLTGTTIYEDGLNVMFSERVVLGNDEYIPGYGFGLLQEGYLKNSFDNEVNEDWKNYLHQVELYNYIGVAPYSQSLSSIIPEGYLFDYIGGNYYTKFMNEEKNGYVWTPVLAKSLPEALDEDYLQKGASKKWRIEVRTQDDGLKYTTNSTKDDRILFNNKGVNLSDYETIFKLLLTKSTDYYGAVISNDASFVSNIKGAMDYYNSSKDGFNAEKWNDVGIKSYEKEGKSYLEFELNRDFKEIDIIKQLSKSIYQPISQEFIDVVTSTNYLKSTSDGYSEVDNSLTLGPYSLEYYDPMDKAVLKKNPNYVYANNKYNIEGIFIDILTAYTSVPKGEVLFTEFLANNSEYAYIPSGRISEFIESPNVRKTKGTSNFKLNYNTTDSDTWEYFFGENGVIMQTSKEDYWEVEPALSNSHFVKALNLAFDRLSFSSQKGYTPTLDYFSSNIVFDELTGESYSTSKAHQKAVASLIENTDGYGYNLELSREYFKVALKELETQGKYVPGTKDNPTKINLEIAWMYSSQEESYHKYIKQCLETAFNDESVSEGKYALEIDFWIGEAWSDVYYNKMMRGQYDIGFGSISLSSQMEPAIIEGLKVLSSTQSISENLTLSWNLPTNDPFSDLLIYNNQRWSYDALIMALCSSITVVDGVYIENQ